MEHEQLYQEEEYWLPYHYIAQFNPRFRQNFNDGWGINYTSTIEFLLERIRTIAPSSIIDVGCGDGRFTRELALMLPDKAVRGLDYSHRAIGLAKAMNSDIPGLRFVACDITSPTDEAPASVAVLMEVFEHIPPEISDAFLAGVRRLLQPNGMLLLTVPHLNTPVEPKHFRHFSIDSIQLALSSHFDVLEVVPFEKKSVRRAFIRWLLGNDLFILNNDAMLDWIYRYYKRHLFNCREEDECQRIFVSARAK